MNSIYIYIQIQLTAQFCRSPHVSPIPAGLPTKVKQAYFYVYLLVPNNSQPSLPSRRLTLPEKATPSSILNMLRRCGVSRSHSFTPLRITAQVTKSLHIVYDVHMYIYIYILPEDEHVLTLIHTVHRTEPIYFNIFRDIQVRVYLCVYTRPQFNGIGSNANTNINLFV